MAIKIDTDAVINASEHILKLNNDMTDGYSSVENAIRALEREWSGAGSSLCADRMRFIKNTFVTDSGTVLNNLVAFMRIQAGEQYEALEKAVTSAAAAFK